jgi:hypothetical protein
MDDLIKVDKELKRLAEEHENLFVKYGGGYDILAIEKRMEILKEKRIQIINEIYG